MTVIDNSNLTNIHWRADMRKLFSLLLVSALLFSSNFSSQSHAEQLALTDYTVSGEILHLREGPGLSYPIIETLNQGQSLKAIKKEGDWLHVQKGDIQGWVASWLVKAVSTTEELSKKSVISQVDHLNLRAEPSLSATVLTKLNSGAEATYIQQQQDWIQIQYGDDTGWVSASYVVINEVDTTPATSDDKKTNTPSTPAQIVAENDPNTFTVLVDAVHIRKKPDLTAKKLGTAKKDEQFKVLSRNNNWVEIQFNKKEKGWLYNFYGTFAVQSPSATADGSLPSQSNNVTIIYNETNLRESASTTSNIVERVNAGDTFPILATENDWYQIALANNQTAYVASWVVTTTQHTDNPTDQQAKGNRKKGTLKGVTIVLDPGHGGNDHGTTGVRGTSEKDINSLTADLLTSKLRAAGANVILTRESDTYVDLRKRVAVSHQYSANAFISIHYDAIEDHSVSGFTTYYTNSYQQELGEYVHASLAEKVAIRDRGVRAGDYLVLRENRQPAILLELGYLSNANEERAITTDHYREQATLGIYQGILNYFDAQLDK